jgi:ABC-2 type transport system permease protein
VILATELRSGPRYWFGSLGSMLRFDYGRMRTFAPMMVVIQTMMGAGMALLYGFLYPHITTTRALYIATGAPTLALIPLGFAMVPGSIGTQKDEGSFEYVWTLPAPRSAQAASTFLLYAVLALPGTALALLVATFRYGVHLSPSPLLVPAALLCALMAIAVGYGMALAITDTVITNLVVNALMFVVLLFSPIVYPPSQLPGWLFAVHRVLPFYNMAVVMRASLTQGIETHVATSFLVLAIWTVAGWATTGWVVSRRR